MPPKQIQIPGHLYSHALNESNFYAYSSRWPLQFDKKIPKQFADLYVWALNQLEMACLPCLQLQIKTLKPITKLRIFSTQLDLPTCRVIAAVLTECSDVQNIQFIDCQLDCACVNAFFSFKNPQIT